VGNFFELGSLQGNMTVTLRGAATCVPPSKYCTSSIRCHGTAENWAAFQSQIKARLRKQGFNALNFSSSIHYSQLIGDSFWLDPYTLPLVARIFLHNLDKMIAAKSMARASARRAVVRRAPRSPPRRYQSSSSPPTRTSQPSNGPSGSQYTAGRIGGIAGASLLYGIYLLTPSGKASRTINKTVIEANRKYNEASKKLQESTPSGDQAIECIKNYCYTYAAWVPGGRQYVDTAFKDVDTVRQNHKEEANRIIEDGYKQFQEVAKMGLSMEAATKAYQVLADVSKKIAELSKDAASDVLDNHPEIKEQLGGNIDRLKQMGDQYPELKKQVDETWQQVKEAGGDLGKVRKLVEDKLQTLGDEAWNKGMEQLKPLLDKSPEVKELVEKNAHTLKKANTKEVFDKVRSAVNSGSTSDLQDYVKKMTEGSTGSTGGLADMLPGAGGIMANLKQLKEVADKQGEKGKQLLQETVDELKQLLEKKSQKAKEIAKEAKEQSN